MEEPEKLPAQVARKKATKMRHRDRLAQEGVAAIASNRIMVLAIALEVAMPWEKQLIRDEILRLQGMVK